MYKRDQNMEWCIRAIISKQSLKEKKKTNKKLIETIIEELKIWN